tara:strand:+ start:409 stop:828 length:420 start_codon:yes stop_codon:yes gene_type:complete
MNNNTKEIDLEHLDIRVFNTLSGRQIVGELVGVEEECVYLNAALQCKIIMERDGSYKTTFITATPFDDSNVLVLYMNSIESEAEASLELKRIYINQLVYNNLISLLSELPSDKSSKNQTNLTDIAKQDYWKDFKDRMNS